MCPLCAAAVQGPVQKNRLLFAAVEALFGFKPFFALAAKQVRAKQSRMFNTVNSQPLSCHLLSASVLAGTREDCSGAAGSFATSALRV